MRIVFLLLSRTLVNQQLALVRLIVFEQPQDDGVEFDAHRNPHTNIAAEVTEQQEEAIISAQARHVGLAVFIFLALLDRHFRFVVFVFTAVSNTTDAKTFELFESY